MKSKLLMLVFLAMFIFTRCEDTTNEEVLEQEEAITAKNQEEPTLEEIEKIISESKQNIDKVMLKSSNIIYYGPKNDVQDPGTYYTWLIKDYGSFSQLPMVKTYSPDGRTTFYVMKRHSNPDYLYLTRKLPKQGHYSWRFVDYKYNNLENKNYYIDNTFVRIDVDGTSSLVWPFGADRSSWTNRRVNGKEWRSGQFDGGPGYGWNEFTHQGEDERYADDWNYGDGSDDLGKEVRSPIDGIVIDISTYYVKNLGNSKYVAVHQQFGNKTYRFYVSHLSSYNSQLYVGKYVRAGIDVLGYIGKTGATSPHAHTCLRDITNGNRRSIKFSFDAND